MTPCKYTILIFNSKYKIVQNHNTKLKLPTLIWTKYINVIFFICICLTSCNTKPDCYVDYDHLKELRRLTCKVENIDLSNSKVLTEQDFMHNYVTEPNYIQLDNSVPLGQIEKIRKYKNNFYILSNDKIYIFNGKGKYLKTIDHKGHGRNEYIVLRDFQILPKENIILGIDDKEKKIFKFSLRTGKCLGTMDEIVVENSDKCTFCEECLITTQDLIHKRDKTEFKHKKEKVKEKLEKEGKNDNEIENELKNRNLDKMNQGQSINYREVIKVEPKPNEFLFKIESTRSLSAKKIILEAFNILKQKFGEIDKILNEIEDKEN